MSWKSPKHGEKFEELKAKKEDLRRQLQPYQRGATSKYTDRKARRLREEISKLETRMDKAAARAICGTLTDMRKEYKKQGLYFPARENRE